MPANKQNRQVEFAVELEEAARTLAHSTRGVPSPIDSYRLLAELARTADHLQQIVRQLSAWHRQVVDGQEYRGEDDRGDGVTGTLEAAEQLETAAAALDEAGEALRAAHSANGVVRWVGEYSPRITTLRSGLVGVRAGVAVRTRSQLTMAVTVL